MESLAAFHVEDWDLFNRMSSNEDDDQFEFMQQILHQFSFPLGHDEGSSFMSPSTFCPYPEVNMSIAGVNENLFYSSNALDSNIVHYKSEESSQSSDSSSGVFVHPPSYETYFPTGPNHIGLTNDATMSLDISMDIFGVSDKITDSFPSAFPNLTMESTVNVIENFSTDCLPKLYGSHPAANAVHTNESMLTRKFDVLELHDERDQINTISSQSPKKRPRVSKDGSVMQAEKVRRNSQSKKARKNNLNGNEESNIGSDGQSSNNCSTSDDDNVSQDTNGVAVALAASKSKASPPDLTLNGRKRASRGSATDPQSLYARKRRERINERLRILQNLVPNGTKVDISTMLEEAVQYVKFLQLQIKLLSSDELWMYAPLAYNGVDIGLNNNICTPL